MAGNKGTRRLDQSTRAALSAIESALLSLPTKRIRDDEFTADQYIRGMQLKGDTRTFHGLRATLLTMEKQGKLKSRKVCMNGKECNAYSKA